MSRSIGQPLANHTQQGRVSAHGVVHAKDDSVIIPEIDLGEVAVEVLLCAVLIEAAHSSLENREEAFGVLGTGYH